MKTKDVCNAINPFLYRNSVGQKARYSQSPEIKNPMAWDTLPRKIIIQKGEIKNLPYKQRLKEYSNTKPILKEILK